MIDETLVGDLADYAIEIFEAGGSLGRVEYAIRSAATNMAESKTAAPSLDEQARAYALACRKLDVARDHEGAEIHPDGRRWPSDAAIVRSLSLGGGATL